MKSKACNTDKAPHPDVEPDYVDEVPEDDAHDNDPFILDDNPFNEPNDPTVEDGDTTEDDSG